MQTTHSQNDSEFSNGTRVIYGLHGHCVVRDIVTREMGGRTMRFYQLEVQKPALSRSKKREPFIWLPLDQARRNGLRAVMTKTDVDQVFSILSNREYYFSVNEPWSKIYPTLEKAVLSEGGIGMAKVLSYLCVIKQKLHVPTSDILRFEETVLRQLLREVSEILGQTMKEVEAAILKAMRHKFLPDS